MDFNNGFSYSKFNWNDNPFTFKIFPQLFTGYTDEVNTILSELMHGVKFSMLSGPTGSGKTTMLKYLTTKLSSQEHIIYLPKPPKDPKEFVEIFETKLKRSLWEKLKSRKTNLYNLTEYSNKKLKNKKCILFIDEAHEASIETLEWIRALTDQVDNLSVVFAGLPVFDNFLHENLETLRRRISSRFELGALNKSETMDLIKGRIENVGGSDVRPFTLNSIEYIYEKTGGFPRDVIKICDDVIKKALSKNISLIDVEFMTEETRFVRTSSKDSIQDLPEKQRSVLEILSKHDSLTPTEIVEKIDVKEYKNEPNAIRSVNNLLIRLLKDNLVVRSKKGKTYKYGLAPKVQPVLVSA